MSKNLRKSPLLEALHAGKDPLETARVQTSMMLSAKIAEALKAKGWTKGQLATALGKSPSIITRWLSGTHNFTSDTLSDIEQVLSVQLLVRTNESQASVTAGYEQDALATSQGDVSDLPPVLSASDELSMAIIQAGISLERLKVHSDFRNYPLVGHHISYLAFPTISGFFNPHEENMTQFLKYNSDELISYASGNLKVIITTGQVSRIKKKDIEEDLCYS